VLSQKLPDFGKLFSATSLGYDALDRLTSYQRPTTSGSYTYDAVGNRTRQTNGAVTTTYQYGDTSNRLTQIAGTQTTTIATDANGSITSSGNSQFTYDARGRLMAAVTSVGTTHYHINALGQRVQKSVPSGSSANTITRYHYDQGGHLIAETTGSAVTEYVYLGDIPVAVMQ
jgi:YD repeat-containing protein